MITSPPPWRLCPVFLIRFILPTFLLPCDGAWLISPAAGEHITPQKIKWTCNNNLSVIASAHLQAMIKKIDYWLADFFELFFFCFVFMDGGRRARDATLIGAPSDVQRRVGGRMFSLVLMSLRRRRRWLGVALHSILTKKKETKTRNKLLWNILKTYFIKNEDSYCSKLGFWIDWSKPCHIVLFFQWWSMKFHLW